MCESAGFPREHAVRHTDYYLFPALWVAWAAYWWLMARNVKTTARRESLASRLTHVLPLTLAAILFANGHLPVPALNRSLIPQTPISFTIGAVLTAAGLLFAVWARQVIGRNWSASVTVKQDHALVTSGPYAWVRHPIYTGLMVALIGSAVALGLVRAAIAVLIALAAISYKLRVEERVMLEQFGATYRAYSARVPRLIPFIR
jgi:protein-S-isoprenylcysteine O-methyltransferase Ste14